MAETRSPEGRPLTFPCVKTEVAQEDMMEFLRKIQLKHAGFVMGTVLLFSGWIMRFAAVFIMPKFVSPAACHALGRAGYYVSGSSVVFLLGGIVFYAFICTKGDKEEPLAGDPIRGGRESCKAETDVIGEYAIYVVDTPDDPPVLLRVFSNGTAYVLFDDFPLGNEEVEGFVEEFSLHIDAKVTRDDRELFIIESNQEDVMKKAIAFLQIKSMQWRAQ